MKHSYCISYLAPNESDPEKRLMAIKQIFVELPDETAKKLEGLFMRGKEFIIEPMEEFWEGRRENR